MSLFAVGRVCLKIAGRDAGKKCLIVEQLDDNYVLVDGATRRKKVNIKHLEPLAEIVELNSGASHEEVKNIFVGKGWVVWEHQSKATTTKTTKQRKAGQKTEKAASDEAKKVKAVENN